MIATSLCDFCKGETSTSLQVDIVRVDECAQGVEGLAREEVGIAALQVSIGLCVHMMPMSLYILEVVEQICDGIPFAVGKHVVIVDLILSYGMSVRMMRMPGTVRTLTT